MSYPTPKEAAASRARFRCTLCNAPMGQCDCWTPCKCGWSFEKGTECSNPKCSAHPTPAEQK